MEGERASKKLRQEYEPVLRTIKAAELPAPVKEMFAVATPFSALHASKEERHSYQSKFIDVLSGIFDKTEASKRSSVIEAETRLAALKVTKDSAAAAAGAARALATSSQSSLDAKAQDLAVARQEESQAKAVQASAEAAERSALEAKEERLASKAAFEQALSDEFEVLKASKFAGVEWRKREKMCTAFMQQLSVLGLDESLIKALPVALCERAGKRGQFAERTISFAEERFAGHVAALVERVAEADREAQTQRAAVVQAVAAVEACRGRRVECEQAHKEACSEWAASDTAAMQAEEVFKKATTDTDEVECLLSSAKSQLDEFVASQLTAFVDMKERKKARDQEATSGDQSMA